MREIGKVYFPGQMPAKSFTNLQQKSLFGRRIEARLLRRHRNLATYPDALACSHRCFSGRSTNTARMAASQSKAIINPNTGTQLPVTASKRLQPRMMSDAAPFAV